jgi:hypothetical protein
MPWDGALWRMLVVWPCPLATAAGAAWLAGPDRKHPAISDLQAFARRSRTHANCMFQGSSEGKEGHLQQDCGENFAQHVRAILEALRKSHTPALLVRAVFR